MILRSIVLSFVLCLVLCTLVLHLFPKWGIMDRPEKYGHKRAPIPYPGGVAIVLASFIMLVSLLPLDRSLVSVLVGSGLLALTSFIDDRRDLSPYLRFGIQILAGISLVLGGIGILSLTNPFGPAIPLDVWELPISLGSAQFVVTVLADLFTIAWVIVMVNAFNWIDGVPGMTSSVAIVASAVLLVLSVRPEFHSVDQTLAITLSSVILGVSLAFVFFDFPPPRMLMGDTGSMFLGFMLAVTAIISGGKVATTILVLGFPILDFVWVILRRILKGQSPFKGDLWHFHHRFMYAGLNRGQTVFLFASSSLIFGALALLSQTAGKLLAFIGIFCLMIFLGLFLYSKNRV